MQEKRKILNIEKRLGFKFSRGLSRERESSQVLSLRELLTELEDLKVSYRHFSGKDLRSSQHFEDTCLDLFDKYGPGLWPPDGIDRSAWLVDSRSNDLDGLYPHNLHFDDEFKHEK